MVAIEIGARNSPPSPRPMAEGSMPRIIAMVVIRIGRSRIGPALRMASSTGSPSRTYWFVRSTSRIAFLVTRPISITMPIIAGMPRLLPVIRIASSAPTMRQRQRQHDQERLEERLELRRQHDVDEGHGQQQRQPHGRGRLLHQLDVAGEAPLEVRRHRDARHHRRDVGGDVAQRPGVELDADLRLAAPLPRAGCWSGRRRTPSARCRRCGPATPLRRVERRAGDGLRSRSGTRGPAARGCRTPCRPARRRVGTTPSTMPRSCVATEATSKPMSAAKARLTSATISG